MTVQSGTAPQRQAGVLALPDELAADKPDVDPEPDDEPRDFAGSFDDDSLADDPFDDDSLADDPLDDSFEDDPLDDSLDEESDPLPESLDEPDSDFAAESPDPGFSDPDRLSLR